LETTAVAKINQRGSTLVEVAVSLPLLLLVIAGMFAVIYLCVAQAWLKDSAEEAALCVAEQVSVHECKRELRKKTYAALPVGDYTYLSIRRTETHIVVSYTYSTLEIQLQNEITLKLPVSKRTVGIR
jgi:Flp pilus assembly protein TadG